MEQKKDNHILTIDSQKSISITCVDAVVAFNDTRIVLSLIGGGKLSVSGSDLKIVGFSKTDGTFLATGGVSGVSYGGKSFAQRLFK